MKRLCAAAVLLLLGSTCYAGESYSFVVGGRHVHIETSRHCRSTSCVSLSISGVYERRARRDRYDDYDRDERYDRYDHDERYKDNKRDTRPRAPVVASPPAPVASPPPVPPPAPPVARAPAPAPAAPAAPVAPPASVQPQPQIQPPPVRPMTTAAVPSPPPAPPAIAAPAVAPPVPPPPAPPPSPAIAPSADDTALPMAPVVTQTRPAPRVSTRVVHRVEEVPDGPLGDWETEGHKGVVRIEPCGQALCGYVLDPSTDAKREAVLIDMKSNTASEWSGSIYSRDSGDTYYATVTLNEPNTLQVEACALWRFWCSRNAWNRILKPGRMVNYRQTSSEPRS
jgi:Uncharacterized protein conserved in bacteria (DUF2147)